MSRAKNIESASKLKSNLSQLGVAFECKTNETNCLFWQTMRKSLPNTSIALFKKRVFKIECDPGTRLSPGVMIGTANGDLDSFCKLAFVKNSPLSKLFAFYHGNILSTHNEQLISTIPSQHQKHIGGIVAMSYIAEISRKNILVLTVSRLIVIAILQLIHKKQHEHKR